MSYEKVTNINIQKHTIRCAANNVHPMEFHVCQQKTVKEGCSDEQFIKKCLLNFYEGNFVPVGNQTWKFIAALMKVAALEKTTLKYHKVADILSDYSGKKYKKEEYRNAEKQLIDFLYEAYQDIDMTPSDYIIVIGNQDSNLAVTRRTKFGMQFARSRDDQDVHHFKYYDEALAYIGERRKYNNLIIINTELNLPDTVVVKFDDIDTYMDDPEVDEVISNWLSDTYGYCHNGFEFKEIMQNNEYVMIYNIQWDTTDD